MIRDLIRKEILANLLSLRFTLALLLTISLFSVSGFVYVARYNQQSQDYWTQTNENLSTLSGSATQLYKLAFAWQSLWRKPKPLTLCAEGFERYLPNEVGANVFSSRTPRVRSRENFLLQRFSDIDWVFIIAIPLSFVALLFTYDSFCGEKEAGTLRLMLSGSIPRHKILIGKYAGALIAFAIPLLVGLLINLVIVASSRVIEIDAGDWLRLLAVFLLSILYLSLFLLLGMFVSSRVTHSVSSIVILLLLWAGVVVLIPSFGSIIAQAAVRLPSTGQFRDSLVNTMLQYDRDAEAGKYGKNAHELWQEDRNHPSVNAPAAARYCNEKAAAMSKLWDELYNRMLAQAHAGRNAVCLSPIVLYQRAAETIAGTGIQRCADLYRQTRQYRDDLTRYVLDQDKDDPNSLHLLFDSEYSVENWTAISKKPVDFATVPKFQERDYRFSQSLAQAAWDIGALLLFNILFFAVSFASFVRYDVR
ncbi:MAG: ABC transporter permease subunit [Sedimentisphaerales bacterium]|nr:ABC transporter permease subunit [Sedimentisphaerales bacterium]